MALKAIIGYDHHPKASTTWMGYADHNMQVVGLPQIDANGWVQPSNTALTRIGYFLGPYIQAPIAKVWVGVRIRFDVTSAASKSLVFLTTAIGTTGTPIFTATDWKTLSGLSSIPAGTIGYFEFAINIATGVIERRFNGADLTTLSLTTGSRAWMVVFEPTSTSVVATGSFRDIYIVNDQAGVSGYQSACIVGLLGFDPVTGTDFTTNPAGGTLIGAINGIGEVPTANIAVSGPSKSPLIASLKPALPASIAAIGIEITVGLASTIAGVSTCSTKLKSGSFETAGANVVGAANGVYTYSNTAGIFEKSPTGEVWNNATIDATDFILTPDV